MKTSERQEVQNGFEKAQGKEYKNPKWDLVCLETKDSPNKPKSLITGHLEFIYPTGDMAFKSIDKIDLWYPETNALQNVKIPDHFLKAKKIVIRREIIASVIYLMEKED